MFWKKIELPGVPFLASQGGQTGEISFAGRGAEQPHHTWCQLQLRTLRRAAFRFDVQRRDLTEYLMKIFTGGRYAASVPVLEHIPQHHL